MMCPKKAVVAVGGDGCGDGCAGGAAAAPRLRGRPPRPPPVAADSAMQAAMRARLYNMLADSVGIYAEPFFQKIGRGLVNQSKCRWNC